MNISKVCFPKYNSMCNEHIFVFELMSITINRKKEIVYSLYMTIYHNISSSNAPTNIRFHYFNNLQYQYIYIYNTNNNKQQQLNKQLNEFFGPLFGHPTVESCAYFSCCSHPEFLHRCTHMKRIHNIPELCSFRCTLFPVIHSYYEQIQV